MAAVEKLPLDKVRPNENQPRKTFYQESLEELAASIKERGVLQPIVVRPLSGEKAGLYEIIMGERRYRASKLAGMPDIPVIIRDMSDDEAAADALLENFQREDMNPVEKARAVQGLLALFSMEKVTKTLGRLRNHRAPHAGAAGAARGGPAGVGDPARLGGSNNFQESHARALIALNDDPTTQMRLLQKIKKDKLSVASTDMLIDAVKKYPTKREVFLHVSPERGGADDPLAVGPRGSQASLQGTDCQRAPARHRQAAHEPQRHPRRPHRRVPVHRGDEPTPRLRRAGHPPTGGLHPQGPRALENKDYGFSEVYIHCPLCAAASS
jgi:ParB family chromosome partitioning protein